MQTAKTTPSRRLFGSESVRGLGQVPVLGEITWLDESNGLSGKKPILHPQCTIGSSPNSTVVFPESIAASVHVTLIFGKRFVLLKAAYPTRIQGKLVKEWLIDRPTEFQIGTVRLEVTPLNGLPSGVALVRSHELVSAANKMSAPLPNVPSSSAAVANETATEPLVQDPIDGVATRFDSIEESLRKLQEALGHVQDSIATPDESSLLSATLSKEIQLLGERITQDIESRWNIRIENNQHRDSSVQLSVVNLGSRIEDLSNRFESFAGRSELQHSEIHTWVQSSQDSIAHLENQLETIRLSRDALLNAIEVIRTELQAYGVTSQAAFDGLSQLLQSHQPSPYEAMGSTGLYGLKDLQQQDQPHRAMDDDQVSNVLEQAHLELNEYNRQIKAIDEVRREYLPPQNLNHAGEADASIVSESPEIRTNGFSSPELPNSPGDFGNESQGAYWSDSYTAASNGHYAAGTNEPPSHETSWNINSENAGAFQTSSSANLEITAPSESFDYHSNATYESSDANDWSRPSEGVSSAFGSPIPSTWENSDSLRPNGQYEGSSFENRYASEVEQVPYGNDPNSFSYPSELSAFASEASHTTYGNEHVSSYDPSRSDLDSETGWSTNPSDQGTGPVFTKDRPSDSNGFPSPADDQRSYATGSPYAVPVTNHDTQTNASDSSSHIPWREPKSAPVEDDIDSLSERLKRMLAEARSESPAQEQYQDPYAVEVPLQKTQAQLDDDFERRWAHLRTNAEQSPAPEPSLPVASYPSKETQWTESGTAGREAEIQESPNSPSISEASPVAAWSQSGYSSDHRLQNSSQESAFRDRVGHTSMSVDEDENGEDYTSLLTEQLARSVSESSHSQVSSVEPAPNAEIPRSAAKGGSHTDDDDEPQGGGEEESIEAYMQKLLQRVKGGGDGGGGPPTPTEPSKPLPRSRMEILNRGQMVAKEPPQTASLSDVPEERQPNLTAGEFMPRQHAPEHKNDLNALRELANINARRAIHRSETKRNSTAILFKISVTSLAVASAGILFLMNGFNVNPPFAGMVAAIIVAVLWGYDCLVHFRKLEKSRQSTADNDKHEADNDEAIALAKSKATGWRPTPA